MDEQKVLEQITINSAIFGGQPIPLIALGKGHCLHP